MENIFNRMNAKRTLTSLMLVLAMSACSSKQGVEAEDELSSEVQAEQDLMLGEGMNPSEENSDVMVENAEEDLGTPTAEIISSIEAPVAEASTWRGSLKSQYVKGMSHWTVSRGESLSLIAEAVYGSSKDYKKLLALNPEVNNANDIKVGQRLRLPNASGQAAKVEKAAKPQAAVAKKVEAPAAPTKAEVKEPVETELPVLANNEPAEEASPSTDTDTTTDGAMGTVETDPTPPADTTEVAAAAPAPAVEAEASSLVKRVDMGSNKLKLRNILLGVAAFFLLLSGVIFVLSRKRAKAG